MRSTTKNALLLAAAGAALSLTPALSSCSTGLGSSQTTGPGPTPASTSEIGLGFDPGVELSDPIDTSMSIAGAEINTPDGGAPRRVVFLAFATAAAADDAAGDGSGALVRDDTPQTDTNAARDIFIAAIESTDVDLGDGGGPRPAAFSQALVNVFRHSRCMNCHGSAATSTEGLAPIFPGDFHPGPNEPIMECACTTCHAGDNVPELDGVVWRAPREADADSVFGFDFRNKTVEELNMMAQGADQAACGGVPTGEEPADDPLKHLKTDGRVLWAITSGNVPFQAPVIGGNAGTSAAWDGLDVDRGAVPITQGEWTALVDAWAAGGFQATNANAVRDLALASRSSSGDSAGDGTSFAPALTYAPNPAFDANAPQAAPAGFLYVAFVTTSSNLVAGATTADQQIVRTTFEVWADRNASTGATEAGGLDLMFSGDTQLVSPSSASASSGANSSSFPPQISADGQRIAFASTATDLVAGFVDGNGAPEPDVYLRDLGTDTTHLVSTSTAGPGFGGNGYAIQPAIDPGGAGVAFSSAASDLVANDSNGVDDVFAARYDGSAVGALVRASVSSPIAGPASEGAEADAAASAPTAFSPDGTRLWIAYESAATTLTPGASGTQIYLHDDELGTTELISRVAAGSADTSSTKGSDESGDVLGNGSSRRPRFMPDGTALLFDSLADNLDTRRANDTNGVEDLLLVSLNALATTGELQPRRLSVAFDGSDADGASTAVLTARFRSQAEGDVESTFVSYATDATNLGASPASESVIVFIEDAVLAPVAQFVGAPLVGLAPLEVRFINQSTGSFDSFAWDFGDEASANNTSTLADPSHVYAELGAYTVRLTAIGEGGQNTAEKLSYIQVVEPVVAEFSVDNTTPFPGQEIEFTDLSTGAPTEWAWNFGDLSTSSEQHPTHVYTTPGLKQVILTATGPGNSDTITKVDFIDVQIASGAAFTATPQSGDAPLSVDFSDLSAGRPTEWAWDFGDGSVSTFQNPSHVYTTPGSYTVTLNVDGPGGPSEQSIGGFITANSPPSAQDVAIIFASNGQCTSCHTGANAGNGQMDLTGSASAIRSRLLNVASDCSPGALAIRVVGGSPETSFLIEKLQAAADGTSPSCGSPMPTAGSLTPSEIDTIVRWVTAGAPL